MTFGDRSQAEKTLELLNAHGQGLAHKSVAIVDGLLSAAMNTAVRLGYPAENPMMESAWATRAGLAWSIFEWLEAFYHPVRRHFGIGYRSPVEFEVLQTAALTAA
jgi:hypothetical protein